MGMYTEFIFGCKLSKDMPRICIESFDYLINGEDKTPKYEKPADYFEEKYNNDYIERTLPIDEIEEFIDKFDLGRLMLSDSEYFGAASKANRFIYDHTDDSYHISTRANLKNYENQISHFLEYIEQYIEKGSGELDIYAYVLYEEKMLPDICSMKKGIIRLEPDKIFNKI